MLGFKPNSGRVRQALPNAEGDLLGVVLFRPTDQRIQGLKSGDVPWTRQTPLLWVLASTENDKPKNKVNCPLVQETCVSSPWTAGERRTAPTAQLLSLQRFTSPT